MLEDILRRLDLWKTHLPEELAFTGPDSGPAAGMLILLFRITRLADKDRTSARVLHLCLHDILASVHEDQLHMSSTHQVLPERPGVEPSDRKLPFGHPVVCSAFHLLG
jgi:hypothetical protein